MTMMFLCFTNVIPVHSIACCSPAAKASLACGIELLPCSVVDHIADSVEIFGAVHQQHTCKFHNFRINRRNIMVVQGST